MLLAPQSYKLIIYGDLFNYHPITQFNFEFSVTIYQYFIFLIERY